MEKQNRISFNIGNKVIGNNHPILIQSMGDMKTTHVKELVAETNDLAKMGMDMMRFSILDFADCEALKDIKSQVNIPIIADIHFDYRFALKAIDCGADKIRINPGNIGSLANLRAVIEKCKERNVPIRIGVNSGSLNKFRGKTSSQVDDVLLAMDETVEVFRQENFSHLVLSLKTSNPIHLAELYEKAYSRYPYPLHIGLTESGYGTEGCIKSSYALIPLLKEGIGDTIRVSLADDRREEIRACKTLLKVCGLKKDIPDFVVCPTCGRTQIDLKPLSRLISSHLDYVHKDIKVALMGCPVNGIGEAKDADYGIAGSGKKDVYLLFQKGTPMGLFKKDEALKKLFSLIDVF
ncbi:MAG: (E)-4-hydroxy-3-methylbut-2-enyl-diphosphate synthase [Bacilli bacterium]